MLISAIMPRLGVLSAAAAHTEIGTLATLTGAVETELGLGQAYIVPGSAHRAHQEVLARRRARIEVPLNVAKVYANRVSARG